MRPENGAVDTSSVVVFSVNRGEAAVSIEDNMRAARCDPLSETTKMRFNWFSAAKDAIFAQDYENK